MIPGYSPVTQALLGTLFTWGLTAAGAALVFIFSSRQKRILDGSLGFAAGVMLAASYWSLLAPAIEMAEDSGKYGAFAFLPVAVGFTLGAAFVYLADLMMPFLGVAAAPQVALALPHDSKMAKEEEVNWMAPPTDAEELSIRIGRAGAQKDKIENGEVYKRRKGPASVPAEGEEVSVGPQEGAGQKSNSWRRIVLLILAITIHNIPVTAVMESLICRNLAVGIGIQNFPEGLAVSLPLRGSGVSTWKAFWYGQLSGMVEPIAGLLGAVAVVLAEPLLPYALAFAAGAMVYVVVDDIIPEAQVSGNGKLASWTSILGFIVMMSLDVGLG
uniref:Zinc transporter ZIP11 n=1 Tax=Denticeps clupeoides TaxID=299321 RepID=A0AAY4DBY1_9TELE